MKNFLLTLLFIFALSAKSQLYVSGNVIVNANGCNYSLDGNFFQSGNPTPLVFVYDSANASYKFLSLIAADSVSICVSSSDCNCLPTCVSTSVGPNMIFNINICNVTDLQKMKKEFLIFPNPFSDFLNINTRGKFITRVYDYQFRLILEIKSSDDYVIPTLDWSSGLYFIYIESNDSNKIYKFNK